MKTSSPSPGKKPTVASGKKTVRPENKDKLDARQHTEQYLKGTDITHNSKETHHEGHKKH